MDRLVFTLVILVVAVVLTLFFYTVRLFVIYAILKKLHERFPHIYNDHYPTDEVPTFLCTFTRGLLMWELRRSEEIKLDPEIYRLVNIDRVISIIGMGVLLVLVILLISLKFIL